MSVQKDIAKKSVLLKAERKSKRTVAVFGTVMFLIIVFALMVPGFGLTRGKLICGLEEHRHGSECYEQTLICTQEEGESHKHNISCYEFKLICDKPVHTHSDSCYEVIDDSADEQNSGEGAEGVDSSDASSASADSESDEKSDASDDASDESESADASSSDEASSDSSESADAADADEEMPEQTFDADLIDEDHKVVLNVAIEAPKGAFPANTAMKIESVDADTVHDEVAEAVKDAKGEDYKVKQMTAVDITFKDADGNEIEPVKDVQVKIRASEVSDYEEPLLVHVLDKSKENQKDKAYDAEVVEKVKIVNWDEDDSVVGNEDTMKFKSRDFSPYVIVEAEKADDDNGNDDNADDDNADADADDSRGSTVIVTTDDDDDADADPNADANDEANMPAQSFKDELKDAGRNETLSVMVEAPAGALPKGATMVIKPVKSQDVKSAIEDAVEVKTDERVSNIQAVDISFRDADGNEIEPAKAITVTLASSVIAQAEDPLVVHVDDKGKADVVETLDAYELQEYGRMIVSDELVFDSDAFSIYAVVEVTIVTNVLTSDGHNYKIIVTCGPEAQVPVGAKLQAEEIVQDASSSDETTEYDAYMEKARETLGVEAGDVEYARLFDIKIVDEDGNKVDIAAPVDVNIELADKDASAEAAESTQVVHFADADDKGNVVQDVNVDGKTLGFEAEGFSVYAIVDAPTKPYEEPGWHMAGSLDEIASLGSEGFFVSSKTGTNHYYLTGGVVQGVSDNSDRNGLAALTYTSETVPSEAVEFYFERQDGTDDRFLVYTKDDSNAPKYVKMTKVSGNATRAGLDLDPERNNATAFKLEKSGSAFLASAELDGTTYYWNRNTKKSGFGAIAGYNNKSDGNVANLELHYEVGSTTIGDPYGLSDDNKSFGIAYHDEAVTSNALMADQITVGGKQRLSGKSMLMRPDVLDNKGVLLVAENSNIQEWSFEWVEKDKYYLKTTVNESPKYLKINGEDVTLEDAPDETYSLITATPGTGANVGKWHFKVGDYSLNFAGSAEKGFGGAKGNGATTWVNLVEKSTFDEKDFTYYVAEKVSVSDQEKVPDGAKVVMYTRVWNDTTKRYDFYAVDHDGSLIRCYDVGDCIEWVGRNVNSALWEFTEYKDPDGSLNYYYELKNAQYKQYPKYIAPQVSTNQVVSSEPIGINLNGRRYNQAYTTVIAWDDRDYAYSGLKVENGRVVPCALSEADDFYFAIMTDRNPQQPEGELTTVTTIDNDQYGITMRMVDFNNPIESDRDSVQSAFFGRDSNNPGLLSTDLKESGYPTITAKTDHKGDSLSELFTGMTDVNHLFLQSIYNESGYFEYDSTQNFAHLEGDGNFKIYDQLGAIGVATGPTRTHGQFMPYNDLDVNNVADVKNLTNVKAKELPDTDPRKGETLYKINQDDADYFFGMEMEASFTQTASGLDAWGHDIIFEFSGDDDFWFYVDDELVLDLGGVHPAMTGSINFRTGEVKSDRGNSTLYEIFKKNYEAEGLSDEEIATKLDEKFQKNSSGQYVFKDYSEHTMKMFYMERGAGASNLHMRFNLAAVRPGTFELSKHLSGTDNPSNDLIEFPYQIHYSDKNGQDHLLGENPGEAEGVINKVTNTKVKYVAEGYTPVGGSASYNHVFFLKPGQTAVVQMPDDVVDYYVVECGVNPDVYDAVKANGVEIAGEETGDSVRKDHKTTSATLKDRPTLDFDNHVKEGAMQTLSITKRLYDSDGQTPLHYPDNETLFKFRLYLGSEGTSAADLKTANYYPYYVKDPNGYFCRWSREQEKFEPVTVNGNPVSEFSVLREYLATLTDTEREKIVFATSPNGTIDKIPADYTVEVRDLVVNTLYKAEERAKEIPRGYTLRLEDGYTRVYGDGDEDLNKTTPITGTIVNDTSESHRLNDPKIEVRNQRGWGLTVNKVWTDKDFMETHDNIYFAVYVKTTDENGVEKPELLSGSVRGITAKSSPSIYYFFDNLKQDIPFKDYIVREVTLQPGEGQTLSVKDDGTVVVKNDDETEAEVDPSIVQPIEEGKTLTIGGTPAGGTYHSGYEYTVTYNPGEQTTQNENVRTDTVTNSRPGIKLYKTNWGWEPLSGARFTLKDAVGNDVAAKNYVSDENGLITIAYLNEGTYTLQETTVPKGYAASSSPVYITVGKDNVVMARCEDSDILKQEPGDSTMAATITIRNRVSNLSAVKVDKDTNNPIKGVHFALYPQVEGGDGHKIKDNLPMEGFKDLVSNEQGVIPKIDKQLAPGTYYLTETEASNYNLLPDLCFTIGEDGSVAIESGGRPDWLKLDEQNGVAAYTLTIPNSKQKYVSIQKVDSGAKRTLKGASFSLYSADEYDDENNRPKENAEPIPCGPTDEDGLAAIGHLPNGEYLLVETVAPAGFMLLDSPVKITVTDEKVTYEQSGSVKDAVYKEAENVWQITAWNVSGEELPSTGGMGTGLFYLLGGLLVAASGLILIRSRRGPLLDRRIDTKR